MYPLQRATVKKRVFFYLPPQIKEERYKRLRIVHVSPIRRRQINALTEMSLSSIHYIVYAGSTMYCDQKRQIQKGISLPLLVAGAETVREKFLITRFVVVFCLLFQFSSSLSGCGDFANIKLMCSGVSPPILRNI